VLGVVPIVELVSGNLREIHRRDQHTLCHDRSSLWHWQISTPTSPTRAPKGKQA
jgi:hypothetical protein